MAADSAASSSTGFTLVSEEGKYAVLVMKMYTLRLFLKGVIFQGCMTIIKFGKATKRWSWHSKMASGVKAKTKRAYIKQQGCGLQLIGSGAELGAADGGHSFLSLPDGQVSLRISLEGRLSESHLGLVFLRLKPFLISARRWSMMQPSF